ncbi:hypothetical protein BC936DRAFT_148807 [Jimgerdemannia flammicorona]|uniref:Uncharacterized protein n=1 Tax=Jimgerdemannia flammicorona TaxID=994334 RepID=A0A433DKC1_9FUNG|nr:hypothetical protein BC936DRAFT_148807 [Jimgerdemannia flammicorona]
MEIDNSQTGNRHSVDNHRPVDNDFSVDNRHPGVSWPRCGGNHWISVQTLAELFASPFQPNLPAFTYTQL